jgi:hypothetical protein
LADIGLAGLGEDNETKIDAATKQKVVGRVSSEQAEIK